LELITAPSGATNKSNRMKTKKQKYINFINQSESIQKWLSEAPSQLLDYDVVEDQQDGLLRIRVLLKNSYLFDKE
tara:strand:+ start:303 stop:527 length:225 start_codon:yes stop_codon:yes gene_type:complete